MIHSTKFGENAYNSLLDLAYELVPEGHEALEIGRAARKRDQAGVTRFATVTTQTLAGRRVIHVALSDIRLLSPQDKSRQPFIRAMAAEGFEPTDPVFERHCTRWWTATDAIRGALNFGWETATVAYPSEANYSQREGAYHGAARGWQSGTLLNDGNESVYLQAPPDLTAVTHRELLPLEADEADAFRKALGQLGFTAIVERHLGEEQAD